MAKSCQVSGCENLYRARGFCATHYTQERNAGRLPTPTRLERFNAKWIQVGECHEWQAYKSPDGYGRFAFKGSAWMAHRYIWTELRGPIPDDLSIDHICNNPGCVRIDHLRLLPIYDNVMRGNAVPAINARKTHCKRGHEFTPENTLQMSQGGRTCRTCKREYERANSWKRRTKYKRPAA